MHLRTALMHEIGHLFGLPHGPASSGKQLMSDRLGASERRLVTEIAVSAATGPGAQEDEGGAPGPGPIPTVQLPAAGSAGFSRSAERRVGKEGVSTVRAGRSPGHSKKEKHIRKELCET